MPIHQLPGESVAEARLRDHLREARERNAFEASTLETANGIDARRPMMHPIWNPLLQSNAKANLTSASQERGSSPRLPMGMMKRIFLPQIGIESAPVADYAFPKAPGELDDVLFCGMTSGSLTQKLFSNDACLTSLNLVPVNIGKV
jgi:hypothetical protein